ncbi:MAG: ferrochelatase [Acidobacteriaceae bacterium]
MTIRSARCARAEINDGRAETNDGRERRLMSQDVKFDAVLLLAHGTPSRVEEVPEYLRRVANGRVLPAEVVREVAQRFAAVGGSPLTRITLEQGRLLAEAIGTPVYVGMRNWHPLIAETVRQMIADGVRRVKVVCLAPQNSRTSVGLYKAALEAAVNGSGHIETEFVSEWFDHPMLIAAFAERLRVARIEAPAAPLLFTAHSVPCRTVQSAPDGVAGDSYGNQAKQTAALVAREADASCWYFAFQSQGMSGGTWIGPTVERTLDMLRVEGVREVIIQPVGFVCDHVEILYDVDVQFRDHARSVGMNVLRPESLNTSPTFIAALADVVRGA